MLLKTTKAITVAMVIGITLAVIVNPNPTILLEYLIAVLAIAGMINFLGAAFMALYSGNEDVCMPILLTYLSLIVFAPQGWIAYVILLMIYYLLPVVSKWVVQNEEE